MPLMVAGPRDFIAKTVVPSIEVFNPDTLTAASPSIFIAILHNEHNNVEFMAVVAELKEQSPPTT